MTSETPADRPAPPPGLAPMVPATAASHIPEPIAGGYTRSRAIVISPRVVAWLPPVFLSITLICTFFPWVGTHLGGNAVDTQGPWGAMFGASPNRNFELEKYMRTPADWLDKVHSDWPLMLPCLLCLIVAVILAWADMRLTVEEWAGRFHLNPRMKHTIEVIWPRRHAIITALATVAFCLFLVQVSVGFGMERGVRQVVTEMFAKQREEAAGSPAKLAELAYNEGQEYAKFNLQYSFWLYLALVCNGLTVLAMLTRLGLDRRGTKPAPRIVLQY